MFVRTRTAPVASLITAAFLLSVASAAGAQQQKPAATKPTRHVDLEVGPGVHFGTAKDTPIEDDFYANIGLAMPFTSRLDGEFQAGYLTARDYDGDEPKDSDDKNDARTSWYVHAGLRGYLVGEPDAATRFYLALGPSLLTDYREDDDATAAISVGPGLRIRIGQQTGILARVPVAIMLEGDPHPLLLPTVNFFYQF